MPPKDCPSRSTVQRYFYRWRDKGLWSRINHVLLMDARELAGHEASPTAGIIDSQSVKATESGGPKGYNAGKKVSGRKRPVITDTPGFLLGLLIHTADIQSLPSGLTRGTATARRRCSPPSAAAIHGCGTSSPMAAMLARS